MNRYLGLALSLLAFGCNGADDDKGTLTGVDAILALTPDTANGAVVYEDSCALCHGADGAGIEGLGTDVRDETDQGLVVEVVLNGNDDGMTAFDTILTEQEIADVSGFLVDGGL